MTPLLAAAALAVAAAVTAAAAGADLADLVGCCLGGFFSLMSCGVNNRVASRVELEDTSADGGSELASRWKLA